MKIGVPAEIKNHEYRVGLIPAAVRELSSLGHSIFIQRNAGQGAGFSDDDYTKSGATIVDTAEDVFERAELIIKVKEPQPEECALLKAHHTLFTFLHLAPDPVQAQALLQSKGTAISYDTVTDDQGGTPLLAPMSAVAGRMSIQVGANLLEKGRGGPGILLSGVAGVAPGNVVILGGGVAGFNAARVATGIGADVIILEKNTKRVYELDHYFKGTAKVLYATTQDIYDAVIQADLVIGSVFVVGAAAPRLVTRDMLSSMKRGSVLVDISIDQGGCFETSRPTTHDHPIFVEEGVTHYCVTNMPGAVARTSAVALNNATLPFVIELAQKGTTGALLSNRHLMNGLNVCNGHITHHVVARGLGYNYTPGDKILAA